MNKKTHIVLFQKNMHALAIHPQHDRSKFFESITTHPPFSPAQKRPSMYIKPPESQKPSLYSSPPPPSSMHGFTFGRRHYPSLPTTIAQRQSLTLSGAQKTPKIPSTCYLLPFSFLGPTYVATSQPASQPASKSTIENPSMAHQTFPEASCLSEIPASFPSLPEGEGGIRMGTVDGFAICICVWDSRMKPRSRGVKGLGGGFGVWGECDMCVEKKCFFGLG